MAKEPARTRFQYRIGDSMLQSLQIGKEVDKFRNWENPGF